MAKKFVGKNVEPRCEYCAYGELTKDKITVICEKKGISTPDSSCKKFSYDPLKREPKQHSKLPEYSAEDFKL